MELRTSPPIFVGRALQLTLKLPGYLLHNPACKAKRPGHASVPDRGHVRGASRAGGRQCKRVGATRFYVVISQNPLSKVDESHH